MTQKVSLLIVLIFTASCIVFSQKNEKDQSTQDSIAMYTYKNDEVTIYFNEEIKTYKNSYDQDKGHLLE